MSTFISDFMKLRHASSGVHAIGSFLTLNDVCPRHPLNALAAKHTGPILRQKERSEGARSATTISSHTQEPPPVPRRTS